MNNLNNLPPFYVGQKVVAIKNSVSGSSTVKKGQIFTVKALLCCPKCKKHSIDVGLKPDGDFIVCGNACDVIDRCGILWANVIGFAPLQQQKFPLISFSEINKKEDIEILSSN